MKNPTSKILAFGVALIVATLAMNPAFANGTQKFKIHIAGGFVQNILQAQVDMMGIPTGEFESRGIALVKGRGTFGHVDIMAVTVSGPPISGKVCSSGIPAIADIVENNLVLTFGDLSLLYGNGTGIVCPNVDDPDGVPIAEVEGTWDGGTGRFAHAGGEWSGRFEFARPVGNATQFIAEAGVLEGLLTRSRKDD